MSDHFNFFGLKNFKRFKNLELDDIGQFNLVLGDNNVGKTSLLEALTFANNPTSFLEGLSYCLKLRGVNYSPRLGTLGTYINFKDQEESMGELTITCSFADLVKYEHRFVYGAGSPEVEFSTDSGTSSNFTKNTFYQSRPVPFIPYSTGYSDDLVSVYSNKIATSAKRKKALIDNLRTLHPGIIDFELDPIDRQSIVCWMRNHDSPLPITSLGQGTLKTFVYLAEFVKNQGFQVMIDEVDAGIYYRRMKDYWKVILQAAKDNNVQLFATTHNKECIESFEEALKELGEDYTEKARTITLKEDDKTGDVTAYTNEFSVLEYAIESGNDIR